MMRKIFAAFFALLAIGAGALGIYLAMTNMNAAPTLLEAPEAARQRAISLNAASPGRSMTVAIVLIQDIFFTLSGCHSGYRICHYYTAGKCFFKSF